MKSLTAVIDRSVGVVLLVGMLVLGAFGCADDNPVSTTAPRGTWVFEDSIDGGTRLHRSYLRLDPLTGGSLIDTVFRLDGAALLVDSIHTMTMSLSVVGDGYQRALEVADSGADTVLRYWFFVRGENTLRFRRGMRFEGTAALLPGSWRVSDADRQLLDEWCDYDFDETNVTVEHHRSGGGPRQSTHAYRRRGDTLTVDGAPCNWGGRFEVVPTSALYLTSFGDRIYHKLP